MAEIINKEKFDSDVLNGKTPAVVDFFTNYCMPCKMLAPVLDQLSQEFAGKVNIFKVDATENMELAAAYQVRSVPTILFFKEGKVVDIMVGTSGNPKASISEKINALL